MHEPKDHWPMIMEMRLRNCAFGQDRRRSRGLFGAKRRRRAQRRLFRLETVAITS
jgi:hypothetical protein